MPFASRGSTRKAFAAGLDDVVRSAAVGGDKRQADGRGFEQGQAKGFVQRRIDEDAAAVAGIGIIGRDIFAAVRLRIGDLAVEIVAVDQLKQLLEVFRHLRLERINVSRGVLRR